MKATPKIPSRLLKKTLKDLSKELTEICDNINCGGCGKMAAFVGKHLEKVGVNCEIVTPGVSPKKVREKLVGNNSNPLKSDGYQWTENGLSHSHLALRFKIGMRHYTWDSNGLVASKKYFGSCGNWECDYPVGHGLSVKEAATIAKTKNGYWNSEFDTKQMPTLKRIVTNKFKELPTSLKN